MRICFPLLAILCVLPSLLVPGIASASTAPGAETRVWAFNLADQVSVGIEAALTLELRRGCESTYVELEHDAAGRVLEQRSYGLANASFQLIEHETSEYGDWHTFPTRHVRYIRDEDGAQLLRTRDVGVS